MIYRFEELSWKELDAMDRWRTMFFLPVSPLEEHGPHLPVGVDFINADFFARETAEILAHRHPEWNLVMIPALALGAHVIDYVGSIRIRQRVIRDLLIDYGSSLARHGFRFIVVFNAHAAPGHIVALEEACHDVSRRHKIQMISPTGRLTIKLFLGKYFEQCNAYMPEPLAREMREDMRKDYHAGLWETSMMLMFRPDLVKGDYKSLAPVLKDVWDVFSDAGAHAESGGGYLGIPSEASLEYARASTHVLREEFYAIIERMMNGEDVRREVTTLYSWIPFLRTDFWSNTALLAVSASVAAGVVALARWFLSPNGHPPAPVRSAEPRPTPEPGRRP